MFTPSTIEQLPSNIPYLKADGSNWAIFTMHFHKAMQATQHWPHFDGTFTSPTPGDPNKPIDDKKKEIKKWDHEDTMAHYLLLQHLPNSIAVQLYAYTIAKAYWDCLITEFIV